MSDVDGTEEAPWDDSSTQAAIRWLVWSIILGAVAGLVFCSSLDRRRQVARAIEERR